MGEQKEVHALAGAQTSSGDAELDGSFLPTENAEAKRTVRHDVRARIMVELARNLDLLGWSQEAFGEMAGLSDRYFSKALHAHEPCGREPTWPVLQAMFDCLFPDGYQLVVLPIPGRRRKEMVARYNALFPRRNKKDQPADEAVE